MAASWKAVLICNNRRSVQWVFDQIPWAASTRLTIEWIGMWRGNNDTAAFQGQVVMITSYLWLKFVSV